MAVSRALRRLLRIRDIEEEQSRLALESAVSELNRLHDAMSATIVRERRGRMLVAASARTNQFPDRIDGIEETRAASRQAQALGPRIESQEETVTERREQFLTKRVERRQAETLIQESVAREAIEAGRRGQQSLDDWFGGRIYRRTLREKGEPTRSLPPESSPFGERSESSIAPKTNPR
jgi:flagellar biosynthesis chaperone FliJ